MVVSATNGDVAFLRASIVAARDARERVREHGPRSVRPLTGTRSITGGVPSTSTERSIRVRLLAASSAIVVTVWRPSAMPAKS